MRLIHSSQSISGARSEDLQAGLGSVSESHLREWVEKISVPRHFRAQREANLSLSHWLAEQFCQWGYEVQLQGPCRNVLALPRHRSSELTLIGAHYDSVPETPGADDNASAIAALLGCAEAISRLKPQTSVAFIAFNCEEDDLLGSTDFVETHLPTAGKEGRESHQFLGL